MANGKPLNFWSELEFKDIFYAYRKAKADCYFERTIGTAQNFANYEVDLSKNLSGIFQRLKEGEAGAILLENLGTPQLVAKKLSLKPKSGTITTGGHEFFSDPDRSFSRMCATNDLIPEFRLIGDFPVSAHIISALWVNLIGHKYDAILSSSSYGSRVRRYKPGTSAAPGSVGDYHIEAVGSFQAYFQPYKKWRAGGMDAIRKELQAERAVVAVSMDLTSYYHNIDPSFALDAEFLRRSGIELNDWEHAFTASVVNALKEWSLLADAMTRSVSGPSTESAALGVPIGLSAVRILANALLAGLDRDFEQSLVPIFYGRYVDDIFLVLRDPGTINDAPSLLAHISQRLRSFPQSVSSLQPIYLNLDGNYQGSTILLLQPDKQKVFFLQGRGGLDLLDNIESEIRSVSSERRLMPSPKHLESMASAKILTAAGHPSEEADTLRRADGLAVRRLGWSIQLRAVEILARDIPAREWKDERARFYQFAHSHILRPDKILDHVDYLPRLLSIAVALTDWKEARQLVDAAFRAVRKLMGQAASSTIRLNGVDIVGPSVEVWSLLIETVRALCMEAVIKSLRWHEGRPRYLNDEALQLCELLGLGHTENEIFTEALKFRESDLAKTSYKDHLRRDASQKRPVVEDEAALYGSYTHEADLRDFLQTSDATLELSAARVHARCKNSDTEGAGSSLIPFLFPTRPYSTQEISLFAPSCVFGNGSDPAKRWARFARAVRGVWVWSTFRDGDEPRAPSGDGAHYSDGIYLGSPRTSEKVLLGISSLLTTHKSWKAAASGSADTSPERYERVKTLINQAITANPRPTHLLLPELSLPERWIGTVSSLLQDANISLIAGLDYHVYDAASIHSAAVLVLTDHRLGFPASVQMRQAKALPAAKEEEDLLKLFGKTWSPSLPKSKPVYVHEGFTFGVLVCSELQNVSYRTSFQGNVDCMMVLSWNQDLETFAALVESASLDVHAHIALVNNRMFGDSRVRAPAKRHHLRDLCRIRGGENEHIVVVELEISALRGFQSRAKRWPSDTDPYKPVPEGFEISIRRETTPS
ncbi:RNA-directed DNA polymerase [Tardiphaga sp. 604_B6_N1_1]|uniref:RNA-directed DNA polymerase n=1 Tax=Tardiphaga sp. 604_B6_N1_1 TaxID=3240779 RepID=UPI003F243723